MFFAHEVFCIPICDLFHVYYFFALFESGLSRDLYVTFIISNCFLQQNSLCLSDNERFSSISVNDRLVL